MKKTVLFLLIVSLLCTMGCYCAADDAPALVCSGAQAPAGDRIKLQLSIQNNPGICSMKVRVEYDSALLTLAGVEGTDTWTDFYMTTSKNLTDCPYSIIWANKANTVNNGVLAELDFAVASGTAPGSTEVTVTCVQCFDQQDEKVTVASCKGTVEIVDITEVVQSEYKPEDHRLALENVPEYIEVYAVVYSQGRLAWMGICQAVDGRVIIDLPRLKGEALEISVFYLDGMSPAGSASQFTY